MLPVLARIAIRTYPRRPRPQPMCGIGSTLVEAVHDGRDAIGVEYEPRWGARATATTPSTPAASRAHRTGMPPLVPPIEQCLAGQRLSRQRQQPPFAAG
jgi:hypothetical protein